MKKIIGLVGETGSGKDIFCEVLKKKYKKVFVFRFSQPLTEALRIFFEDVKKEDQQWLATELRERFGNNILGQSIAKRIRETKEGIIILNGIRAKEEFSMIKKMGGKIIYITTDQKLRWQRIINRGEKKDDKSSYKDFLKKEKAKTEIQISRLGKNADFQLKNNGSLQEFYKNTTMVLQRLGL